MIYRSLDTGELLTRKQTLLDSISSFSSQTVGGKSFTRDLVNAQKNLEAIIFVLNERTTPYEGTMLTDFSNPSPAFTQPAGSSEQL